MKYYLDAFINSLYNISWLSAQRNNTRKATNYVVLFLLALAISYAIYTAIWIPKMLGSVRDQVFTQVPDFTATMENHILTAEGIEQPFVYSTEGSGENYMVYIDTTTTTEPSFDTIAQNNTSVLVILRDHLVMRDAEQGQIQTESYSDIPDTTITKDTIVEWVNTVIENRPAIFIFSLLFWFVVLGIGKLVYVAFLSLLVLLVVLIAKKQWNYGQIFTVMLFAVTAPSIINALLMAFGIFIPYLYSIALLGLTFAAVFYTKNSIEQKPDQIPPVEQK